MISLLLLLLLLLFYPLLCSYESGAVGSSALAVEVKTIRAERDEMLAALKTQQRQQKLADQHTSLQLEELTTAKQQLLDAQEQLAALQVKLSVAEEADLWYQQQQAAVGATWKEIQAATQNHAETLAVLESGFQELAKFSEAHVAWETEKNQLEELLQQMDKAMSSCVYCMEGQTTKAVKSSILSRITPARLAAMFSTTQSPSTANGSTAESPSSPTGGASTLSTLLSASPQPSPAVAKTSVLSRFSANRLSAAIGASPSLSSTSGDNSDPSGSNVAASAASPIDASTNAGDGDSPEAGTKPATQPSAFFQKFLTQRRLSIGAALAEQPNSAAALTRDDHDES